MPIPLLAVAVLTTAIPLAAVIGWKAKESNQVQFAPDGSLVVGVAPSNNGEKILAFGIGAIVAMKLYKGGR